MQLTSSSWIHAMKLPVLFIEIAFILPILAWAGSLGFHWLFFGKLFIWNDMAYMPLLILTASLEPLYDGLEISSHAGVVGYTFLAALAYRALASIILMPVIVAKLGNGGK